MESCSSENASEQYLVTDWAQLHSIDEIMSSFGLPERTPMANVPCPRDLPSTIEHATEKNLKGMKRKRIPECDAQSNSSMVNHSVEGEKQKDVPTETSKSPMDKDGKKEDYIHIQARRGQATNSHSLAERVRREKISERMKLLQEIVPGCNKITGKAVMLDEIINYVQSLQKQVEFLSMKLAAVNPETNLDMQEIYTKEILNSRYGSSPSLGYCHQVFPVAQIPNLWDNEFQNAIRMGLISNIPNTGTELNVSMKTEL